jgi:hypothetical protein
MGLATNFVIQDVEAYEDPYAGKRSDADVTCRGGQVLVYHLQHNQYICTSSHGAALWVRYGMAEIVEDAGDKMESDTKRMDRGDLAKKIRRIHENIRDSSSYEKSRSWRAFVNK